MAALFEDPRLKSLVQVGLEPFLDEWFSGTPGLEKEVAVLVSPDVWFSTGYTPVPDRVLFLGVTNTAAVNADRLYAGQKSFWDQYKEILPKESKKSSLVSNWNRWIESHVGKVANNTGVLLEDLGRGKEAFEAYTMARTIDTNNLSALLNQLTLANAESLPDEPRLQGELAEYERRIRGRLDIWLLSYHYGYVRNPEAFANRGWLWAMSGKPKVAIREMRRALATGANKQKVELAMASFYSHAAKAGRKRADVSFRAEGRCKQSNSPPGFDSDRIAESGFRLGAKLSGAPEEKRRVRDHRGRRRGHDGRLGRKYCRRQGQAGEAG